MDKQSLAVMIPVLAVFFIGITAVSRTLIGRAIAKRIGGEASSEDVEHRLAALEREVDGLHRELAETHERLDFAERALAQSRERPRLAEGTDREGAH